MRVLLTGGGTDGHIAPLTAVIVQFRTNQASWLKEIPATREPRKLEFIFAGAATEKTKELFAKWDVPVVNIKAAKWRRYPSWLNFFDLFWRLPLSLLKALLVLWQQMPDVVLSKGGFGSVPIALAARWYRIPVVLHESDVVPGLANRLVARFAKVIAIGFHQTRSQFAHRPGVTIFTGTPSRVKPGSQTPTEAKQALGFATSDTILLVLGGSQGAQQINELILQVLPTLITEIGIIHVTGQDHWQAVNTLAQEILSSSRHKKRYQAHPYLSDNYATALTAADIVVSRAGASSLTELAIFGKVALFIPLVGSAGEHQLANAKALEQAGAALVLESGNVKPNLFEQMMHKLLAEPKARAQLSQALRQFAQPESAQKLAEIAFNLGCGRQAVRDL